MRKMTVIFYYTRDGIDFEEEYAVSGDFGRFVDETTDALKAAGATDIWWTQGGSDDED